MTDTSGGYIRLYRKMTDWEWYKDYKTLVIFLHLLLLANWKPGRFMGYEVPAGCCATSIKSLSERTGISQRSVRTALEHLKNTHEIDIQPTSRFCLIFIRNWAKYQGDETAADMQMTSNRHATDMQPTTIEERKKERKKENTKRKRDYAERSVTDSDFTDLFLDLNGGENGENC